MDVLIIGGTRFLGRHITDALLEKQHNVTLFNRGISGPDLFPNVQKIIGDRDGDLDILQDGKWDSVIDTCGYFPRIVSASAELLVKQVKHYTFISTVSVYRDFLKINIDENYPVGKLKGEVVEEITGETYGPLKVMCEDTVNEIYREGALIVRPGLIVGPYDPTDRFTYWPWRVALGGTVMVPESLEWETQFIDGRDLARWIVKLMESRISGTYNAVGPEQPFPIGKLLECCREISHSNAKWEIVDASFLLNQKVAPWMDLPVWMHGDEFIGINKVSNEKAVAAGLEFSPVEKIIEDTLDYVNIRQETVKLKSGLSLEREKELFRLWNSNF